MTFETLSNTNYHLYKGGRDWIRSNYSKKGIEAILIEAILTEAIGSNAMKVLYQAGIKIVTGVQDPIKDAVKDFNSGKLKTTSTTGYNRSDLLSRRGGRIGGGACSIYSESYQPPIGIKHSSSLTSEEEKLLSEELKELEIRLSEMKRKLGEPKK
ncbi:NifB/NifX family molybdenum-iron cluster-binding protein [Candidatus Bathyarchaeota archaeon]|nr:NifB/NifX family molybdenum-iron cluster-binding protein [Candidatus Bathyarchaeota archaeon]